MYCRGCLLHALTCCPKPSQLYSSQQKQCQLFTLLRNLSFKFHEGAIWGMEDVFAGRVLQAASITCNSFLHMKCHPSLSLLKCLTVHYPCNFLGRDSVTRAAFTGKLLRQIQREFGKQRLDRAQGKLQLQHLSLKPCSHPRAQGWLCPPGVLTPSFPTRKTAEQWIPRISSFPFHGFSTSRVRPC